MIVSNKQLEFERTCDNLDCSLYDFDRSKGCKQNGEKCRYQDAHIELQEHRDAIKVLIKYIRPPCGSCNHDSYCTKRKTCGILSAYNDLIEGLK